MKKEAKFFKAVYDIINYWEGRDFDNLTNEKFSDRDKIEGAFHSFFTMIDGCSSVNDFDYYDILDSKGKKLKNIDGYTMYVNFRKFKELEKGEKDEDKN